MPAVELPPTRVMSIQNSWAVITASHLRLRDAPSSSGEIMATLWRSSILEVLTRSSTRMEEDDTEDYWYQIQYDGLQGWVFGSYIDLYETKEKALNASRELH